MVTIEEYLTQQIEWSGSTFGTGCRTQGILHHALKEILEIQARPSREEWIDLITLALDGYWRHVGPNTAGAYLMRDLLAKLEINKQRNWPPPGPEDQANEHSRGRELLKKAYTFLDQFRFDNDSPGCMCSTCSEARSIADALRQHLTTK